MEGGAGVTVVVGLALDQCGLARQYRPVASRSRERTFDVELHHWAMPASELRANQPATIAVNIGHDPELEVGQVAYIERNNRGAWFVCKLDNRITPPDGTYYSLETDSYEDHKDVFVTGIALVERPAQTGLQPVTTFAGDLSDVAARAVHQTPHCDLLKRANGYNQRRRRAGLTPHKCSASRAHARAIGRAMPTPSSEATTRGLLVRSFDEWTRYGSDGGSMTEAPSALVERSDRWARFRRAA